MPLSSHLMAAPKQVPGTRRAWGTRFDSLDPSPPSSPVQTSLENSSASANSKTTELSNNPPHEASVFIGSLPTNVDEDVLVQRLTEHLAGYPVKGIKIVRDAKGGVCAFVQCEDTPSAERLIYELKAFPKAFMGRNLRYEFARAFRTLLISYRAPVQLVHPSPNAAAQGRAEPSWVQLEPADAMRIVRPAGARHPMIIYKDQARSYPVKPTESTLDQRQDPFDGAGLVLDPLHYDENSLHAIVAAFGPLEHFSLFNPSLNRPMPGNPVDSIPVPHNGPRSSCMDPRCWEVKWVHRDHCVAALMTLRRIPHMTVTWARHLAASNWRRVNAALGDGRPAIISPPPFLRPSPRMGHVTEHQSPHEGNESQGPEEAQQPRLDWSESDFPPLNTPKLDRASFRDIGAWAERKIGPRLQLTTDNLEQTSIIQEAALGLCPGSSLDVPVTPDTPDLSLSPTTPLSPRPDFPSTPGAHIKGLPLLSDTVNPLEDQQGPDPSSIFVGGLESTLGVWDESLICDLFSKYGVVESVHLVRPSTNKAAFAFVKFQDALSATQAVDQEHNQLHFGRFIRVQLRDGSPSSRSFRGGRGKGRHISRGFYRHPFSSPDSRQAALGPVEEDARYGIRHREAISGQSLYPVAGVSALAADNADGSTTAEDDATISVATSEVLTRGNASSSTLVKGEQHRTSAAKQDQTPSTPPDVNEFSVSPESHKPNAAPTTHGWSQCTPSYPVAFPIGTGYGYPLVPNPSFGHGEGTTDPASWTASSYSYRYPYAQWPVIPSFVDPSHATSQPPLHPTGFIQGEQGTLIPVYQPDALGHYMANARDHSNLSNPQVQAVPSPPVQSFWNQSSQAYPVPMPFMPYSVPLPAPPAPPSAQQAQIHRAVHGNQYPSPMTWLPPSLVPSGTYFNPENEMTAAHTTVSTTAPPPYYLVASSTTSAPHNPQYGQGSYHRHPQEAAGSSSYGGRRAHRLGPASREQRGLSRQHAAAIDNRSSASI